MPEIAMNFGGRPDGVAGGELAFCRFALFARPGADANIEENRLAPRMRAQELRI